MYVHTHTQEQLEHYWEKTGNNMNKDLKYAECYSYCWGIQCVRRMLGDEVESWVRSWKS